MLNLIGVSLLLHAWQILGWSIAITLSTQLLLILDAPYRIHMVLPASKDYWPSQKITTYLMFTSAGACIVTSLLLLTYCRSLINVWPSEGMIVISLVALTAYVRKVLKDYHADAPLVIWYLTDYKGKPYLEHLSCVVFNWLPIAWATYLIIRFRFGL